MVQGHHGRLCQLWRMRINGWRLLEAMSNRMQLPHLSWSLQVLSILRNKTNQGRNRKNNPPFLNHTFLWNIILRSGGASGGLWSRDLCLTKAMPNQTRPPRLKDKCWLVSVIRHAFSCFYVFCFKNNQTGIQNTDSWNLCLIVFSRNV